MPLCLELQGAVIGARLAKNLSESLSFSVGKHFFSGHIREQFSRGYTPINDGISNLLPSELENIPTEENIADEATKWKRITLNASEWPINNCINSNECEEELRLSYVGQHR